MAIVAVRFRGVPDGEIHPRWYEPGDVVTGDLARVAMSAGWATDGETAALSGPPETAKKKGSRAKRA